MGQYGSVIGGVVGAFVGFWVGAPQLGWAIGSALGGAYSASQQVLPGPKIGDVQTQTAQEGGFRPIVYGRSHPIMGNVIADGGPVIVKKQEEQGKGGPKVETEYAYRTYAVGTGEGESILLQAWRNGIQVYNQEDPSMAAENAKFLEYARWYSGTFDQMPDPDLQAIYGAANTPAFRGTSYLVLANEDVTDQRGMWSQWQVRVFRGAARVKTSAPYSAYYADGFGVQSSARTGSEFGYPPESMMVGSIPLASQFFEPVKTYEAPFESLSVSSVPVGGSLVSIVKVFTSVPEGLDVNSQPITSQFEQTVLVYPNYAPEGVDVSSCPLGGTLS